MPYKPVILIIAHKDYLTENEKASLLQCFKILGKHPIKLICPRDLNISTYEDLIPGINADFIDPSWQHTYEMFNRLKCSLFLFDRYKQYSHILFYELDAWVFRDELLYWCNQNFDYIGAPWFEGWNDANDSSPFTGVGNGGFSLRNIRSSIKIARRVELLKKIRNFWYMSRFQKVLRFDRFISMFNTYFKTRPGKSLDLLTESITPHEDYYWSATVTEYFSDFKIASIDEAIRFSFEVNPAKLYKMNNHQLPFGCHAWEKCDPDFWTTFIHPKTL